MRTASALKSQERPQILLVDDNNHGLVARKTVLEELGYCVAIALNGEEALGLYCKNSYDVVVTDYRMPRMDGSELIRKIREVNPDARIIMLSGFVDPLGLTEDSTGANVVLSKSAGEVGNLIRAVKKLLNRRPQKKPPVSHKAAARAKAGHYQ